MSDEILDAVLADLEPIETVEAVEESTTEAEGEPEEAAKPAEEVQFPKKAVNAISRRDKQIGKLKAQSEFYQAELARMQHAATVAPQKPQSANDGRPNEKDYQNYAEYIEAVQDWKLEKRFQEVTKKQETTQVESVRAAQERQWLNIRSGELDKAAEEYMKTVPDLMTLLDQNAATIQSFPPAIKRVIYEIDAADAVKAFHKMAQDDTLDDLADMTPVQATAAIIRAANAHNPRPTTKAPTPMASAKGTGSSKNPSNMTPDELVRWINS